MSSVKMSVAGVGLLLAVAGSAAPAPAQQATTKQDAVLVVDGVVREVFRSARQGQVDYVVQLEVRKSELGPTPRERVRVFAPAPGESVYVHAVEHGQKAGFGGFGGAAQPAAARPALVPPERAQVRAYLVSRARGGWEGTGADWFESTSNELVPAAAGDPPPPVAIAVAGTEAGAPAPSPAPAPTAPQAQPEAKSALASLGLTGEGMKVQGRFVLKVTSTEPGGPAQRAGIEPGDVIVAANERELTGLDQLDALAKQGGTLNLVVLDINSGKGARVAVDLTGAKAGGPVAVNPNQPAPAPPKRSLGFSAEPVSLGLRTGMKIVTVDKGSLAETAGFEPGDIITAINDVRVTSVETLAAALHKSGPELRVTVRDSRTNKDTVLKIDLAGGAPTQPAPAPIPTGPGIPTGGAHRLGIVGEVVFLDTDSAVMVTEIEPGSAAEKAGIEPGDVIVEANGTPILHPNTLNEVVAKSGPVLKLIVVDPKANRKTPVEVKLGQ